MDLRLLKTIWTATFDWLGVYDRRLRQAADRRPWFILFYHRVVAQKPSAGFDIGLCVDLDRFKGQLTFFKATFHICTVQAGLAMIAGGNRPDKPLLSLTFDDGYLDNAEIVLPILQQHDCSATFFVCTGPIEEERPFWWDVVLASATRQREQHWQALLTELRVAPNAAAAMQLEQIFKRLWSLPYAAIHRLLDLDHLDRHGLAQLCPPRMRPDHLRELAQAGMEIGAHTCNHPNLTKESPATVRHEIGRSKALLESWIARPVHGFAPPHGFMDDAVKAACRAEQLTYIASTKRGLNCDPDPFELARLPGSDAPLASLKRGLTTGLPSAGRVQGLVPTGGR